MFIPTVLLLLLLTAAVATDLRSRRIRNPLIGSGLALGFGLHALALAAQGPALAGTRWWAPLVGMVAGFAALMPLYVLRACGAGDVKLMAMVGAFVGPQGALAAALYAVLAGGLLSLAFMLGRGVAAQTLANVRSMLASWTRRAAAGNGIRLQPLEHTAARLPYAVAIALGTVAALVWPL